MKVFILTTVMAPYRVQLFNEIGKQCELYVCFEQRRSAGRDEKWYDEGNANFHLVELKKWDASLKTVKLDVIEHVRRIRPDVVIAYEYHTNTSLMLLSYCLVKKIPYMINIDGAFVSKSLKDVIKRFFISRASGFISSGAMADKYLLHYGAKESRISHNHFTSLHAADILPALPTAAEREAVRQAIGMQEKQVVLSIGQFIHRKGYDVLLKAMARLPRDISLYIIGGKVTPEYSSLVEELKLSNVHFVDFMSPAELKKYFIAADVFVLPTREDVWGLVINEAMAHGMPVVTTDRCVAGIELIQNDINGYIVPVEDHESLQQAISKVLSDDGMRNRMAAENLGTIRDYTYETSAMDVTRAIEKVYGSVNKKS